MSRPLAVDLYCGLGGWTEGLLAEGYEVIGFDIECHEYGEHRYPAQLVIQDVLTLHGSQFRDAALIVASPPCQAYSYRAMPWKRAKALPPPDNTLFEACFRIQREACEASGRHVPMVVENVKGAQPWVGRARWNFGSFYLWGDVPALMPPTFKAQKNPGFRFDGSGRSFQSESVKNTGGSWFNIGSPGQKHVGNNPDGRKAPGEHGVKHHGSGAVWFDTGPAALPSSSPRRKMASAMIAKIPRPLAQWIAKCHYPQKALPSASPAMSSIAQMNAGCGPERLIA